MGARRAGKSSIQKVVFHKMSPHETLFLESTNKIVKNDIANSSFVQFEVWDFPGHVDTASAAVKPEVTFGGCCALVWVIDAQDDFSEALQRLQATIVTAHRVNPNIAIEIFLHKVDSFSEEQRHECQREIQSQLAEELTAAKVQSAKISFQQTSIYDHSVFEAFSTVVQQLIPQLSTLENLLDLLVASSHIEKVRFACRPARRAPPAPPPVFAPTPLPPSQAFIFDVISKIFIATDSSPVDMQSYELCADMIDAVIDVSSIYGLADDTQSSGGPAPESNCVITLSSPRQDDGTVIYLREANRSLALVCILSESVLAQQGLLEYNFGVFRAALFDLFKL